MRKLFTLTLLCIIVPLMLTAQTGKTIKPKKKSEAEKSIRWMLKNLELSPDTFSFLTHLPNYAQFESFTTYIKNKKTGQYDIPNREFFAEFYSNPGSFYVEAVFVPSAANDSLNGRYLLTTSMLEVIKKPAGFNEKELLESIGYIHSEMSDKDAKMHKNISRWEGKEKNIHIWQKTDNGVDHVIEIGYALRKNDGYFCDFKYYRRKPKK